jgi:NSS family neurotransmitter:Na+ symporter
MLGRKAQRGAVGIFVELADDSTLWKTAGWLGVVSAFLILSFYTVVSGWGLNYVFMCLNQFYLNLSAQEITEKFDILASSGDITLFWHFIFTALTVAVVYPGIRHGVEYWSKIMTSALLVLLVGLACYSTTLDGFWDAVDFLLYPDYAEFKPSAALEALGLSFFTLSLGQGVMLTYGSYMRRTEDIPRTSIIIALMIVAISLLAGLMIFPIIFTFGFAPQGGPGLVFKTLPVLFAKLRGSLVISTAFFTLFVFTALTSAIALLEVVVANFMDLLGWSRKKSVLIAGGAVFVFGIPSALSSSEYFFANWARLYGKNFFSTIDNIVSSWLLPIGGLMIAIYTGWVFEKEMSREEFQSGTVFRWLWRPWRFFIRWVAPAAIGIIMLQKAGLIDVDLLLT